MEISSIVMCHSVVRACGHKGSNISIWFLSFHRTSSKIHFGADGQFYSQTKSTILQRHGRWARRAGWLGQEVSLGRWRGSGRGHPAPPHSLVGCWWWTDRARAKQPIDPAAWLKTTTHTHTHRYIKCSLILTQHAQNKKLLILYFYYLLNNMNQNHSSTN